MTAKKDKEQSKFSKFRHSLTRTRTATALSKIYIVSKFDEMEQFKHFTISAIVNEKQSLENSFTEATDEMTEDEAQEYAEFLAEDYFLIKDVFQKISLNSFIIILYSYIESGMNKLCRARYNDARWSQKKKNQIAEDKGRKPEYSHLPKIKFKDMSGKGIRRAKRYLEKVFCVSFDPVKYQWEEINALANLRNAIVHDNSIANEKIKKDGKITKHINQGRINITTHSKNSYGYIVIKPEYLDAILPITKDFFEKLEV